MELFDLVLVKIEQYPVPKDTRGVIVEVSHRRQKAYYVRYSKPFVLRVNGAQRSISGGYYETHELERL